MIIDYKFFHCCVCLESSHVCCFVVALQWRIRYRYIACLRSLLRLKYDKDRFPICTQTYSSMFTTTCSAATSKTYVPITFKTNRLSLCRRPSDASLVRSFIPVIGRLLAHLFADTPRSLTLCYSRAYSHVRSCSVFTCTFIRSIACSLTRSLILFSACSLSSFCTHERLAGWWNIQ